MRQEITPSAPQGSPEEMYALLGAGLTDTQRLYLTLHCHGIPMRRIAEMYRVNVSTVSRTISRASSRLKRAEEISHLLSGLHKRLQ